MESVKIKRGGEAEYSLEPENLFVQTSKEAPKDWYAFGRCVCVEWG